MEEDSPVLTRAGRVELDPVEVRELLRHVASLAGAAGLELTVTHDDRGTTERYGVGSGGAGTATFELDLGTEATTLLTAVGAELGAPLLDIVSLALRAMLRRGSQATQADLLRSACDAMTCALLLFDGSGDIVYANPRGDELLCRQTEQALTAEGENGELAPLIDVLCRHVQRLLDGPGVTWNGDLGVNGGDILSCQLRRIELRLGGACVIARIESPSELPEQRLIGLVERHGLSPREVEVAHLLLEGLDTVEMSQRLGISAHTVRDHLKRLRQKVGARSRGELVSLIACARLPGNGN